MQSDDTGEMMMDMDRMLQLINRALAVPQGEWSIDSVENCADRGFASYQLFIGDEPMADSLNSGNMLVMEEADENQINRWDENARRLFEFIEVASPTTILKLTSLLLTERVAAMNTRIKVLEIVESVKDRVPGDILDRLRGVAR